VLTSEQLAGKQVELPKTEVISHDEVLQTCKEKGEIVRLLVEEIVGKI